MTTFYHWTDTGSPGRNLSGTVLERLQQILTACLVAGYGQKAAAGWSLIHSVTGGFSLQNANASGAVNFTRSGWSIESVENLQVRLVEHPTDYSGPILIGENMRSGAGAPSSSPQEFPAYQPLKGLLSGSAWVVVADANTFIISMTATLWDTTDFGYSVALYVGEDSSGNFIAMGGENDTGYGATGRAFCGGYTVLKDPNTGLVISGAGSAAGSVPFSSMAISSRSTRGLPLAGSLQLTQARWMYGSQLIGNLKGIVYDDYYKEAMITSSLSALGLDTAMESFGFPVQVDGINLAAASGAIRPTGTFFLTDAAEFW